MNDVLARTAEFFFIPESILSTVFLVIFVGIFAYGIYRRNECLDFLRDLDAAADEQFKALATKMTPEMFLKKNLRKLSVSENLLEELPNVFVSIGIVATFLGLGVAIQGAAELLQTDKLELPKLTAVLGVIAFKFQTSVWGICFSIIFRNVFVKGYFDFRRQLVDEITDRLYMLDRENTRTLIERQNELLAAQHKELISALARLNTFKDAMHADTLSVKEMFAAQHREMLAANSSFNQSLLARLNTFKDAMHADNTVNNEHLNYLVKHFKEFFEAVNDFTENELVFAKSVDNFAQRVKLFQEEFATLIHKEIADLKAVNENLGRIHAEHIQKIHDEHVSNIFYTTQELDKLHQKFYLEVERFSEKTRQTLDNLLETTIGRVHDEYTREAHEIRTVISELNTTLATIENNIAAANQEFISEQKQFIDSWHTVTNKIAETMNNFIVADTKANDRLNTLQKLLGDVAYNMQNNYAENFERTDALMKDTVDKFQTVAERIADMQENFLSAINNLTAEQGSANAAHLAEMTAQSKNAVDKIQTVAERIADMQENFLSAINNLTAEQGSANAAHLAEMTAQSQDMVDAVKALKEKISQSTFDNQSSAETLRDELVAVKNVLENLIVAIQTKDVEPKKIPDHFPEQLRKFLPLASIGKFDGKKSVSDTTFDGRDKK